MKGPVLALVVVLLATSSAVAQPSEAVQRADQLFQEGRKLLDAGNAAAACPKFEESQRLDPGLGTLLNLADCYERTGRLASALSAFRSSEEQARRLGEKRRETAAADRARALEGRVPRVTITLAAGERPTGFEVRRNGAVVTALDYGRPIAVDPGATTIDASAPGHEPFHRELTVGASQSQQNVDVPMLAPSAGTKPPPGNGDVLPPSRDTRRVDPGAGRRRLAYIIGGVGVAALGAGVGLGVKAKGDYDDAGCTDGVCPDRESLQRADDARSLGNLGTVVGGVGVAALTAGVVLWLTAPSARTVEVMPTASLESVGFTVRAAF